MEGLDRSIVTEGYPTEAGLHFLWSDHQGWPVVDVVRVQVTAGIITWWRGTGGTDRRVEIPRMFGFDWNTYLGSSRITSESLAHFDMLWARTSFDVKKMLALKDKET